MQNLIRLFITGYRKLILITAALIMAVAFVLVCRTDVNAGNSYEPDFNDKRFTNYTVRTGDSLWNVAEAHMDYVHYSDIYEYIDEIRELNHLDSDAIYYGQNLIITYYADNNT